MDDLISRQAAIDAMKNRWKKTRNYEGIGDDIAEECELYLKQVPSAQTDRKHGEWIAIWDRDYPNTSTYAKCSECGNKQLRPVGCFCKWCGADMRGEQDEKM